MMDWSSPEDANFSSGEFRLAPENNGGLYLDEGYDPLGRRRMALTPGETRPREAGFAPPDRDTHWGRAEAAHWRNRQGRAEAADWRGDQEAYERRPPGWPLSHAREGFAAAPRGWASVGIHQSDTANLPGVYGVSYDGRPAGYSPEGAGRWARLLPAGAPGGPPAAPCAGQFVPADFTRDEGQKMAFGRTLQPVVLGAEGCAGGAEGFAAGAPARAPMQMQMQMPQLQLQPLPLPLQLHQQLQLLFLFIIAVMLAMILRSVERSQPVAGCRHVEEPRWAID